MVMTNQTTPKAAARGAMPPAFGADERQLQSAMSRTAMTKPTPSRLVGFQPRKIRTTDGA